MKSKKHLSQILSFLTTTAALMALIWVGTAAVLSHFDETTLDPPEEIRDVRFISAGPFIDTQIDTQNGRSYLLIGHAPFARDEIVRLHHHTTRKDELCSVRSACFEILAPEIRPASPVN